MSTRVTIEALTLGDRGQRYRVWHAGAVIVESSSAPEFDACRALLGLGVSGRLEVWRYGTSFASMRLDIENGARLTSTEGDRDSPRVVYWRRFAGEEPKNVAGIRRAPAERPRYVREYPAHASTLRPSSHRAQRE